MKLKRNIISNLAFHIISIGVGFFTSILVARGLGTENQGKFSYYLLIFEIIASYGNLGITSSTSYFIKKSNIKKDNVINTNISVLLVLSAIYILGVLIFKNTIFLEHVYILGLLWSSYAIILLFNTFFTTIYIAEEKMYVYNKYFILANVLKCVIIAALYYTNHLTVISISMLYALLEVMKNAFMLKELKISYKFQINMKIVKQELQYGLPLFLAGLLIYLNYRVDQVMVKNFFGNSELGIYAIAVRLAELALVFPKSIGSAFEGRLYSCKEEDRKSISAQVIKFSFYGTMGICMIGILCKPLIEVLYGEEYSRAGIPMVILLIGIIFASMGKVAPAYFFTKGNSKIHLIVSSMVLAINLTLNAILIPKMGINGAALASTISYVFYGIVYIIMLKRDGIYTKEILLISKGDIKLIKESLFKMLKRKQEQNEQN